MKKIAKGIISLLLYIGIAVGTSGCNDGSSRDLNDSSGTVAAAYELFRQETVNETSISTETAVTTAQSTAPQGETFILNTNTKKYHYPYCSSVELMNENNKKEFCGDRDDIISQGYSPCKRCNP